MHRLKLIVLRDSHVKEFSLTFWNPEYSLQIYTISSHDFVSYEGRISQAELAGDIEVKLHLGSALNCIIKSL